MSSRLVGGFCLGSDVGAGLGEIPAASAGMTGVGGRGYDGIGTRVRACSRTFACPGARLPFGGATGWGRWSWMGCVPPLCLRHLPPPGGENSECCAAAPPKGEKILGRCAAAPPEEGEIWGAVRQLPRRGEKTWVGGGWGCVNGCQDGSGVKRGWWIGRAGRGRRRGGGGGRLLRRARRGRAR